MTRTHVFSLLALIVAIPAAAASSFFASSAKPCFLVGNVGYELIAGASADYSVRIDNTAASPSLRMQVVDDAAAADFVLIDDGEAAEACKTGSNIRTVRFEPTAANADLTIAVSAQPADYKIYVRSANFTAQDGAALFAVIWQSTHKTGQNAHLGREFAARH